MFWIFMMIVGGAATFATLGMYSVWSKVLTMLLLAAILVIASLVAVLLWGRLSRQPNDVSTKSNQP